MMRDAILSFPGQFSFVPTVENEDRLESADRVLVLGMGGSHLAADLLAEQAPNHQIRVHNDYGLPWMSEAEKNETLVIASSYSGNTEETIDGLEQAIEQGLNIAIISTGGKLIDIAKQRRLPYIQLPDTGIQPRSANGYSLIALSTLIGYETSNFDQVSKIDPEKIEAAGKKLAKKLEGKIPLVYASRTNTSLAYNWKIKLNETGKIPAFCNVIPELNHNEMNGFDANEKTKALNGQFAVILLRDPADHPRHQIRFDALTKLYRDRGIEVIELDLGSDEAWTKLGKSLLLADWTALAIAELHGAEPEKVAMIEAFKKMITK